MLGVIRKKPNDKEATGQAGTAQPSQVPGASGNNGTASK